MITAESEGLDELRGQLEWMREHHPEIIRFLTAKMAEAYREELGVDADQIHMIRVDDVEGDDASGTVYGVSVEPEPEVVVVSEIKGSAMFLSPESHDPPDEIAEVAEANPWAPETMPIAVGEGDPAVWVARDASGRELEDVRSRNIERLDGSDMSPLPDDAETMVEPDPAYNAARAEFGFGDDPPPPKWRPALRELINNRLEEILDDITDSMVESEIDDDALPRFEPRSEEWLSRNRGFVELVWG